MKTVERTKLSRRSDHNFSGFEDFVLEIMRVSEAVDSVERLTAATLHFFFTLFVLD